MGVGKTVEALAVAYIYQKEWPLLIICPSSLKYTWREQVLRWFRSVKEYEVQIYQKTGVSIREKTKILIVSYDLAQRSIDPLKDHFNIAIADEAHYLKGLETKRAETVVPLLKVCKRVILLTGTPAFAKPKELFSLLSIVRPDIYFSFTPFGERYCNPQKNPWSNTIAYDGSKNEAELHYILKNAVMIRRLKS
jgi:SWI/SNF-related matrix-associated actin-dependent regulator 1 of chromatin subfamily A